MVLQCFQFAMLSPCMSMFEQLNIELIIERNPEGLGLRQSVSRETISLLNECGKPIQLKLDVDFLKP